MKAGWGCQPAFKQTSQLVLRTNQVFSTSRPFRRRRGAGRFGLVFLDLADDRVGRQQQAAMLAAFCRAVRSTFVGTITPILTMSPYSWVRAL